jgi:hypothetical protein
MRSYAQCGLFAGVAAEEPNEDGQTGAENLSDAVNSSDSGEKITVVEGE